MLADAGRRGVQRSEVKEEPAGRGTRTELSAMPPCVLRAFWEMTAMGLLPTIATKKKVGYPGL
ncbi:MAG: hypothetical protein A3F78_05580 [Burkholderiales bacterium RIFCSPLOWO2_12_FULL_61_40]|nr:MAG: hypothetical protein A3F78_05580 [Burkholderiales bacterium RIFCSPLOWO2_12_FULL_61_40]